MSVSSESDHRSFIHSARQEASFRFFDFLQLYNFLNAIIRREELLIAETISEDVVEELRENDLVTRLDNVLRAQHINITEREGVLLLWGHLRDGHADGSIRQ